MVVFGAAAKDYGGAENGVEIELKEFEIHRINMHSNLVIEDEFTANEFFNYRYVLSYAEWFLNVYKMKNVFILVCFVIVNFPLIAQQKNKQKQPSQSEINKMMEDAMKAEGMSKEEQAEMKKMMEEIMPVLVQQNATTADYPTFASNNELVPARDAIRINAISKKAISNSDINSYVANLFNKIMTKGKPTEVTLVKQVLAKTTKANDISAAAVTAMLQGHPEAAMALSMKAVQLSPANVNYQNNMAALLTQYGYAEQAIPVLQKVRMELPGNSTVLNNLAHAWLSLGEKDSARMYANGAMLVNPSHPDALLCGGLMDEVTGGDPIDKYTGAMESAPNEFIKNVIKNNGAAHSLDWNKIKKHIAIYEYFPQSWMQMPAPLSNNVKGYNEDMAMKGAYSKMVEKITTEIETMTQELSKELENLADKDEAEFVKTMAKESIKGLSFMSKPATEVLQVLQSYQMQVQISLSDSLKTILTWKEKLDKIKDAEISRIEEANRKKKNSQCKDIKAKLDELENEYLVKVNTRLRNLLTKNVDEYRQWLNAWITWNWYVVGNVKNVVLIQDLGMTAHLVATYGEIVHSMEALPEHCTAKTIDIEKNIAAPPIPNFTCPAVVNIPSGSEWNQLSNEAKNFDANKYGIKKGINPVPNVSVAYGVGNMIAQPGIAPYIKTANGSVLPATGGADELAPIPNIDKSELAPIPKIPLEQLTPIPNIPKGEELVPIPDLRKSQLAKELLKHTMTASCGGKKPAKKLKVKVSADYSKLKIEEDKFVVGIGELVMDPIDEFVVGIGELVMDPVPGKDEFKVGIGKLEIEPISKSEINKIMQEVKTAVSEGLQPTISSGLQVPGTFTLNKGLFK